MIHPSTIQHLLYTKAVPLFPIHGIQSRCRDSQIVLGSCLGPRVEFSMSAFVERGEGSEVRSKIDRAFWSVWA